MDTVYNHPILAEYWPPPPRLSTPGVGHQASGVGRVPQSRVMPFRRSRWGNEDPKIYRGFKHQTLGFNMN